MFTGNSHRASRVKNCNSAEKKKRGKIANLKASSAKMTPNPNNAAFQQNQFIARKKEEEKKSCFYVGHGLHFRWLFGYP